MNWPTAEQLNAACLVAPGYRYELLKRQDIPHVVAALSAWQPSWRVGAASAFLRTSYYEDMVSLDGEAERDVCVYLFRAGEELVSVLANERIPDSRTLYGNLAILSPAHRGKKLGSRSKGDYLEVIARHLGLECIYAAVTLEHPMAQKWFEAMGYRLAGFHPGFDREEVAPGVVKRVVEAVYVKLLVPDEHVLLPDLEAMTPTTRRLYEAIFDEAHADSAA